ncbi:hypothetical protein M3638_03065 [Oceanobacillus profundus]|nr:hypothetical protein [Oceanobacillus profundus]MCM3396820.1 hypothetical protein [Oceanobacillus profundus]
MPEHIKKEIVNYLLSTARKHQLSMEEIESILKVIKEIYYSDAVIK